MEVRLMEVRLMEARSMAALLVEVRSMGIVNLCRRSRRVGAAVRGSRQSILRRCSRLCCSVAKAVP